MERSALTIKKQNKVSERVTEGAVLDSMVREGLSELTF